jgi:DNA replication and repair protein RecF
VLESLQLSNVRSHEELQLSFGKQTVLLGANGVGKTNVLEAISLLSLTTSWRAGKDSEVIAWGKPFLRITSGERELVVQRTPYYKRIRVDGVSKRAADVVGTLPTVLFQPDDSQLVTGSPAIRRAALDRLLSQSAHGYLGALSRLQRVLKQRNRLLKQVQDGTAASKELEYWNVQLAEEAVVIRQAREEAAPALGKVLQERVAELLPGEPLVTLLYEHSPRAASTQEAFVHHLEQNQYKEIAAGGTLYGPQREDLTFLWGEHPAAEGMSRGQIRALVLGWKLAEVTYLEAQREVAPILLLDDVYSEFDRERRAVVTRLTRQYQSVLTTTDIDPELMKEELQIVTL